MVCLLMVVSVAVRTTMYFFQRNDSKGYEGMFSSYSMYDRYFFQYKYT